MCALFDVRTGACLGTYPNKASAYAQARDNLLPAIIAQPGQILLRIQDRFYALPIEWWDYLEPETQKEAHRV